MAYQMHVLLKFLSLLVLALMLSLVSLPQLFVMFISLNLVALLNNAKAYLRMLRRIRWLLLVLLVIYAFSTPGEYIKNWPVNFSPSYEGVRAGLMQAMKIATMLAGLSLLLTTSTKEILIGGIYQILKPLELLKIDTKKFAVRIWLTMHYVETQDNQAKSKLTPLQILESIGLHEPNMEHGVNEVILQVSAFTRLDYFLILLTIAIFCFFLVN
jgi:energy-coupling factor transporter transmembrane protein EcfT